MQVAGGSVVTIEGLAGEGLAGGLADGGELDPVQQSFLDNDGAQCGYCTPGFVLAAKALLEPGPFSWKISLPVQTGT